ncbi:MAG TPA: DUF4190 domain-containing protein [Pirellulales bacterium]|jgi:hypothetical protein|nr:DUF4190 domain-containing protein [Pirellulales bacterium]
MSIDTHENPQLEAEGQLDEEDGFDQYLALSSAAVVALVLGLLSLLSLLDYWLLAVPIAGVIWSIMALRQIRARPEELTGRGMAWVGLVLSAVLIPVGPWWAYRTEMSHVPSGYRPISYDLLQPDPKVIGEMVPQSARDLSSQKVYIKGYVYAGSDAAGIQKFVLCRDAGTCCFGGNPKITDRIVVSLANPSGMIYTKQPVRVAGTFRFSPRQAPGGIGVAYYHLDNAELR